jgi:hypothetical protein
MVRTAGRAAGIAPNSTTIIKVSIIKMLKCINKADAETKTDAAIPR